MRLGEIYLQQKDWLRAASSFRRAAGRDRTSAVFPWLEGYALIKAGSDREGKRLMDLAHLIPLDSDEGRAALAEAMVKHGDPEAARARTCSDYPPGRARIVVCRRQPPPPGRRRREER